MAQGSVDAVRGTTGELFVSLLFLGTYPSASYKVPFFFPVNEWRISFCIDLCVFFGIVIAHSGTIQWSRERNWALTTPATQVSTCRSKFRFCTQSKTQKCNMMLLMYNTIILLMVKKAPIWHLQRLRVIFSSTARFTTPRNVGSRILVVLTILWLFCQSFGRMSYKGFSQG